MEDDQQFCLRWNNHQSTLVAVFDTLLEKGNLVDCTLAAEGKFLKAHKVVLSACSPYFEALLSQNYDKHPIFILKDVKFQELKAMMDYMYRGEVNISQDQLGALLKAAESLQIKGLSDNKRSGGGGGGGEERRNAPPPPPQARSPPPGPSLPRVQGLTIEQRKREVEESLSREGSQSPALRRRKRNRRKSDDNLDNHHELSNSSESHHSNQASSSQQQQQPPQLTAQQNIPATIPATKLSSTAVPEQLDTKSEVMTKINDSPNSQVPNLDKIETHSELIIEPKSEYDEVNDDSIEDLTLDEDDLTNMEDMDDQGAGPSHGNIGEGSAQGFATWHMGNQSQDEVFLAASEAVGANRDAQAQDLRVNRPWERWPPHLALPMILMRESMKKSMIQTLTTTGATANNPLAVPFAASTPTLDVGKPRHSPKVPTSPTSNNDNNSNSSGGGGGFDCSVCGRIYKLKSSLRNHQKWECGKEPQFKCPHCVYKAKQKMHMARHMERMHKEIDYAAVKQELGIKTESSEAE